MVVDKLQEIKDRLDGLNKRGYEGFSAKQYFNTFAETDMDWLIQEVERLKKENENLRNIVNKLDLLDFLHSRIELEEEVKRLREENESLKQLDKSYSDGLDYKRS